MTLSFVHKKLISNEQSIKLNKDNKIENLFIFMTFQPLTRPPSPTTYTQAQYTHLLQFTLAPQ